MGHINTSSALEFCRKSYVYTVSLPLKHIHTHTHTALRFCYEHVSSALRYIWGAPEMHLSFQFISLNTQHNA